MCKTIGNACFNVGRSATVWTLHKLLRLTILALLIAAAISFYNTVSSRETSARTIADVLLNDYLLKNANASLYYRNCTRLPGSTEVKCEIDQTILNSMARFTVETFARVADYITAGALTVTALAFLAVDVFFVRAPEARDHNNIPGSGRSLPFLLGILFLITVVFETWAIFKNDPSTNTGLHAVQEKVQEQLQRLDSPTTAEKTEFGVKVVQLLVSANSVEFASTIVWVNVAAAFVNLFM